MNPRAIFAPFLAVMLLTMIVWFYMYSRRIPLIQKSKLRPDQITAAELARISPPAVANPSDNLKNLFEIPILFYAVVLYLYATGQGVEHDYTHCRHWIRQAAQQGHPQAMRELKRREYRDP